MLNYCCAAFVFQDILWITGIKLLMLPFVDEEKWKLSNVSKHEKMAMDLDNTIYRMYNTMLKLFYWAEKLCS